MKKKSFMKKNISIEKYVGMIDLKTPLITIVTVIGYVATYFYQLAISHKFGYPQAFININVGSVIVSIGYILIFFVFSIIVFYSDFDFKKKIKLNSRNKIKNAGLLFIILLFIFFMAFLLLYVISNSVHDTKATDDIMRNFSELILYSAILSILLVIFLHLANYFLKERKSSYLLMVLIISIPFACATAYIIGHSISYNSVLYIDDKNQKNLINASGEFLILGSCDGEKKVFSIEKISDKYSFSKLSDEKNKLILSCFRHDDHSLSQ